ncbi:MAG: hypothetical protein AAF547_03000 [Actinomycetota bacterium]
MDGRKGAAVEQRQPNVEWRRRRVRRALAAALVTIGMVLLAGPGVGPVGAQDPLDCSRAVVDTSGVVDVAQVVAAISEVDPRATVIVRAFDAVPDGDLPAAIDDVVATCFGDENAGVRPDVIVLGLSVGDAMSDVLVGSDWGAAVSDPEELRSEVMGRPFSVGDFTGGLVDAVDRIAVGVETQLAEGGFGADESVAGAPSDSGSAQDEVGAAPSEDGATNQSSSPEGEGQSPLAIGGAIAAVAVGGGAFVALNRQRRLAAARRELEAAMATPMARFGSLRERESRLLAQAELWAKTSAGETANRLDTLSRQAASSRAATDQARSVLTGLLPDGAGRAGLGEVERARARVLELSRALDDHDASLDRLDDFGAHLDHLRVAVPEKATLLDEELDEAGDLVDERAADGWAVDGSRNDLAAIGRILDGLHFDGLELDLLDLSRRTEEAEARLFATVHYLQALPSRVGSLKAWIEGLEAATELEIRRIDDIRRQFVGIAAYHASDSWQWAADNPEQALDHLRTADQIQERVISELLDAQRFDEAGHALDDAGLQLIAADRLLDQVDDLIVDLDRSLEEAPRLVTESRQVLDDVTAYVDSHRADLEPEVVRSPEDLATAIAGLEHELGQVKPNYLRVAETADRVNRQLDDLLVTAEEQHLRMESLRRELRRETERASRSIGRARRSIGWELFPSRDGGALDELERRLRNVPPEVEDALDETRDIADDALRIQERIIARRRRSGTWVSTGGGGWNAGGGGWSTGSSGQPRVGSGGGRSFSRMGSAGGGRSFGGGRASGSF